MLRCKQAKPRKRLRAKHASDAGLSLLWRSGAWPWGSSRVLWASVRKASFFRHRRICAEVAPIV